MDDLASRNERLCENASVLTKAAQKLASGYAGLKDLELEGINLAREREELITEFTRLEAAATDGVKRAQIRASLDALALEKLQDRWVRTEEQVIALERVRGALPIIEFLMERIHEPRKKRLKELLTHLQEWIERADQVLKQSRFDQTRVAAQRLDADPGKYAGDGFVGSVRGLIKGWYSAQAHEYQKEIGVRDESFLGLLHMLANDSRAALEIANPPGRVRAAIRREQRRSERRNWKRLQPLENAPEAKLADAGRLESNVIFGVDWARAMQDLGLSEDQKLAMHAKLDGLNLQSAGAPAELGMEPIRVNKIRRSLGSDRAGKRLQKHFAAYKRVKSSVPSSIRPSVQDKPSS